MPKTQEAKASAKKPSKKAKPDKAKASVAEQALALPRAKRVTLLRQLLRSFLDHERTAKSFLKHYRATSVMGPELVDNDWRASLKRVIANVA